MSLSVANRTPSGHEQPLPAVVFAVPGIGRNNTLKALFFGVILALGLFAGGAVARQDSPLGIIAPDQAAACGFATFNAKIDDANELNNADYSATGAVSGYAGAAVRVFITAVSGDAGAQWCNLYKYNAFSETSSSATQWTYMGFDADPSGTCDYVANNRTTHRSYFFRGTGGNCGPGNWNVMYDPPSYAEGANDGWIRNLSCTTYAAPYTAWTPTGTAQKPHAGCQGTTLGFEPTSMAGGIFIDSVAPTAPTWTVSGATAFKSGNTLYFRKVAATFSITLTHTETLTTTKSGGQSFSWGNIISPTGWSGYTSGDVASTTTSTKSLTSSTTSANTTIDADSNDRADNDGTNVQIALTADASLPTVTWVTPAANDQQAASSYNFTWTEADTGSGVASRTVQKQTAPVSAGNCGTFTNSGTATANATTSFNYTGMVTNTCYRIITAVTDNVGNVGTSTSSSILVDTNAPTATIAVDGANATVYRVGDTVYYRGGVAGNVNITISGSDAVSGFQDQRFNAMAGTTTGWNPTAATAYTATNPYTLNYAWGATSTGTATLNGTVRNNAGLTANTTTLSLTLDSTAPSLSFNAPTGATSYTADSAFIVDFNAIDAGSGFARASAGWSMQRQRAVVTNNSCGTYSNNGSAIAGQVSAPNQLVNVSDLQSGYCYRWVLSATDGVGNTANATSSVVVMDETAPDEPVISSNTAGVYVSGSTVFVNTSAGGSLALTATSADPETGITTLNFSTVTTAGGWSPTTSANVTATSSAATKTYTWTTGASAADLTVSATSGAGVNSSALAVTFEPDNGNPTVTIDNPTSLQLQTATSYDLAWTGEDAESGVTSYSVQRQRGTMVNANNCTGVTYTNDGSAVVTTDSTLTSSSLLNGYCYRWNITATDYVGHTASSTTASVLVDTAAPTATITYSHANSATTSPFVRGNLTITATLSEPVASTPLLTIKRNGSAVVTNQAMTATGNPLVFTYLYNITNDGDYDLFLSAADVVGNNMSAAAVGSFAVIQQEQTITFAALGNKTYGDANFTVSATASSGLTVQFAAAGNCSIATNLVTITGAGSCTITASQAGNDEYLAAPDVARTFTIAKATLTVTANNNTRVYGASDPSFSATITGFVNGEVLNTSGVTGAASFNTNANAASNVGTYTITPSAGSLAAANYAFSFATGDLTITQRPITATAAAKSKTYGDTDPALTYSVTGGSLVNGDTFAGSLTRAAGESIGTYAINVGSLSLSANYNMTYQGALLTISQRPLTVNVDNKSRPYGAANPTLTGSITGIASGDSITASYSTTATAASPTGTYAINASVSSSPAGVIDNYTVTINPGTLTVGKSDQTITFGALANKTYGDPQFTISATASSGLAVSFSASGDCGVSLINKVTITGAGSCTITATQAGNTDWNAAPSVPQSFTIAKATPVITWADPAPIQYGTVLSNTQLNATTTTGGTFTYTPPAGTLLEAGTHPLAVSFVPTNSDDYNGNSKSVSIDVTLASPPVETGLRNWTFQDEEPRFGNGVTVVTDPTAPSGDNKVALLSSASGQKTATSEHVGAIPGTEVRVWGDWRLSGHGTRLRLCFDVGGCTSSATVGNLTGSIVYSIDWITFELSTIAPANSTEAWLEWTVGSDSYSDGFSWSTLAATDGSITRIDVGATIAVTAPAVIDFGAGITGDALDYEDIAVNVVTNDTDGYALTVEGTDLDGSLESIAISQMQIGPANGALTSFSGENAPLPLGSTSARTDAAGDDYAFDARLTLPFTSSGLYEGTLLFTATTN